MTVDPSSPDELRVSVELPVTPDRALRYWTDPEQLVRWWPTAASVELEIGGAIVLEWPAMGVQLEGRVLDLRPAERFAFSWRWSHQRDEPERRVVVEVAAVERGARVTVTHGPYGSSARERTARSEHEEGWTHFLGQLAAVSRTDAASGT